MMGNETNNIIEELFKSLLQKYQEGLEEEEASFFSTVLIHCIITFKI